MLYFERRMLLNYLSEVIKAAVWDEKTARGTQVEQMDSQKLKRKAL